MPDVVRHTGAKTLVTVINEGLIPDTPSGIAADRHLKIAVHDIAEPMAGFTHPSAEHVVELLAFASRWDRRAPLVVHCWAGISRSTAAAFITLCALHPGIPEKVIADRLRQASNTAMPNRRLVALADDVLARGGRMVEAIAAIGAGRPAVESDPFWLPASQESLAERTPRPARAA